MFRKLKNDNTDTKDPSWGCFQGCVGQGLGALAVVIVALIALWDTPNTPDIYIPNFVTFINIVINGSASVPSSDSPATLVPTPTIQPTVTLIPTNTPQPAFTPTSAVTLSPTKGISTPYVPSVEGITDCNLQILINENTTPSGLVAALDRYYDQNPSEGGAWSAPGLEIKGPAVFWTNLFEAVENLSPSIGRLRIEGGYGVFFVNETEHYTIPSQGGRFLNVVAGPDCVSKTSMPATSIPASISNQDKCLLETLTVKPNTNVGLKYTIKQTGSYIFRYIGGAYSTYLNPPSDLPTWLTAIAIFKGAPIFNDIAVDQSKALSILALSNGETANPGFWLTQSDAENSQKFSTETQQNFNAGDIVTFLGIDEEPYYGDNPGEVTIQIELQCS